MVRGCLERKSGSDYSGSLRHGKIGECHPLSNGGAKVEGLKHRNVGHDWVYISDQNDVSVENSSREGSIEGRGSEDMEAI